MVGPVAQGYEAMPGLPTVAIDLSAVPQGTSNTQTTQYHDSAPEFQKIEMDCNLEFVSATAASMLLVASLSSIIAMTRDPFTSNAGIHTQRVSGYYFCSTVHSFSFMFPDTHRVNQ